MSVRRLLFVCSGNTCRSPLAERLAVREARNRGVEGLEVRSAGTFAGRGAPASSGAVIAARRSGLDLSGHRSSPLGPDLVEWADLVIVMTAAHRRVAEDLGGRGKVRLATEFLPEEHPRHGRGVDDPVGGGADRYQEVLELLEETVEGLFDSHLASAGGEEKR